MLAEGAKAAALARREAKMAVFMVDLFYATTFETKTMMCSAAKEVGDGSCGGRCWILNKQPQEAKGSSRSHREKDNVCT